MESAPALFRKFAFRRNAERSEPFGSFGLGGFSQPGGTTAGSRQLGTEAFQIAVNVKEAVNRIVKKEDGRSVIDLIVEIG